MNLEPNTPVPGWYGYHLNQEPEFAPPSARQSLEEYRAAVPTQSRDTDGRSLASALDAPHPVIVTPLSLCRPARASGAPAESAPPYPPDSASRTCRSRDQPPSAGWPPD